MSVKTKMKKVLKNNKYNKIEYHFNIVLIEDVESGHVTPYIFNDGEVVLCEPVGRNQEFPRRIQAKGSVLESVYNKWRRSITISIKNMLKIHENVEA